jgi:hypothetical protein
MQNHNYSYSMVINKIWQFIGKAETDCSNFLTIPTSISELFLSYLQNSVFHVSDYRCLYRSKALEPQHSSAPILMWCNMLIIDISIINSVSVSVLWSKRWCTFSDLLMLTWMIFHRIWRGSLLRRDSTGWPASSYIGIRLLIKSPVNQNKKTKMWIIIIICASK